MRVSGKSLLKVSTGVPTTSNVGPASSWNAVTAMGVLECSHSAVSAEDTLAGRQFWNMLPHTSRNLASRPRPVDSTDTTGHSYMQWA
ncbi:hypothetical protein EMCRGX_G015189 [Ephydatia muelleri]